MKTIFTVCMLILIASTASISYYLFVRSNYYSSAFLTLAWYISLSLLITLAGSRKLVLK